MNFREQISLLIISLMLLFFGVTTKLFRFSSLYSEMVLGWLSSSIAFAILLVGFLSLITRKHPREIKANISIIFVVSITVIYSAGLAVDAWRDYNLTNLVAGLSECLGFIVILSGIFIFAKINKD